MNYTDINVGYLELPLAVLVAAGLLLGTLIIGRVRRGYLLPLAVALLLRATAALMQRFLILLPEGDGDAVSFEQRAWDWASSGCGNLGEHLTAGASYMHSWLVGNLYACTDRMPLVFQAIGVGFGLVTVYLVGRIAEELWDRRAAVRAAWVAALYPNLVILSAVPLREAWFTAFFLLAVLWLVRWVRTKRSPYLCGAVAGIAGASVFHGAAVLAFVGLGIAIVGWSLVDFGRGRAHPGFLLASVLLILGLVGGISAYQEVTFSKIGRVGELINWVENAGEHVETVSRGGSAYPDFLIPAGFGDMAVLTPIRVGYLLFGPPPWEIRQPSHLFGLLDGLIYLFLTIMLARHRYLWRRREYQLLFAVVGVLVLVFSWGVSNFGTGMRHRAKFLGVLLAMGAGFLGNRRWRDAGINQSTTQQLPMTR